MSNGKNFTVHILGWDSAMPTQGNISSSQVIKYGKKLFMVDCAEGAQNKMIDRKLGYQNIDTIFISHLHGDHMFGLIAILCVMNLGGRTKKLRIVSPHGLQALYQPMLDMFCTDMRYEYEFVEVDDTVETIVYEDSFLTVTAFPLHHSIPCVGYLFKEKVGLPHINIDKINRDRIPCSYIGRIKKGIDFDIENGQHIHCADYFLPPSPIRSYAYCSDTSYFEGLADYVRGCDFLYHEASFKEEDRAHAEKFGHSTAMDAARTAKDAEVKHLIIGHISERYGDKYEVLEEARSVFAHTILAQDLNIINIY